jgi:uncharacterized membrane protein YheB (UPF0754 family)
LLLVSGCRLFKTGKNYTSNQQPKTSNPKPAIRKFFLYLCPPLNTVAVAQLVRASDCGSEGRGFEAHQSPQKSPAGWGFLIEYRVLQIAYRKFKKAQFLIFKTMTWWLFLIPVSCAFSSWLVIKLFFIILFRPHKAKSFFGIRVQGILPAKQSAIAAGTGKLVAEQLFSMKIIEEKITDPANLQKIMPSIEEHIDDFLRNKLKKEMPFIGMFIGDKTIDSLKKVFITELETLFPKIMTSYASNLANDLNIEQLVVQKIAAVSLKETEAMFRKNLSKELRLAGLISAFIGTFTGFVVMLIIFYIK